MATVEARTKAELMMRAKFKSEIPFEQIHWTTETVIELMCEALEAHRQAPPELMVGQKHPYQSAEPVKFQVLNKNTTGKRWAGYTDQLVVATHGKNTILLQPHDLKELEDVIGAKFKC